MTAQEMAALLDGREYKQEMSEAEIALAQAEGLVVVYGYSDDTTLFHGAIEAEIHTVNDSQILVNSDGIFEECPCDCIHAQRARSAASVINVLWCKGPFVWRYDTLIPHASFDIRDNQPSEGMKFSQGIVFELSALNNKD